MKMRADGESALVGLMRFWLSVLTLAGVFAVLGGCSPSPVLADGTVAVSPAKGPSADRLGPVAFESR
jgi:hypothetical protein